MPIKPGDRTHLPESGLAGEQALLAAVLRQALADRQAPSPRVRTEAQAWFASGSHRFWLSLAGLPETALDREVKEEDA